MYSKTKRRSTSLSIDFLSMLLSIDNGGSMKTIKELSREEKEHLLGHLGRIYRKGCLQMTLGLQGMVEDCGESSADMEIAAKIRLILRKIPKDEAVLLIYDFFEIKKSNWWKEQYTKESYHEKKSFAMDAFLRCLYA